MEFPQTAEHGRRTRHQHQEHGDDQRVRAFFQHAGRRNEQAEHHEHGRLRQPRQPVHHPQHMFGCPAVLVADDDAREVHRQKPAAADEVGKGEHQQPARNNHQRIQPLRQIQTAYQLGQYLAAEPAQQQAEAELPHQHPQERQYARPLRLHNQANQRRNQKNRHRVVGARFDFQCCLHALVQAHAAVAQRAEHRARIGRTDNRRHQDAELPVRPQIKRGKQSQQQHGRKHAPSRQHRRRFQRDAETFQPRAQPAVKQDDRQRKLADDVGLYEIVEVDTADAVFPRQHSDREKHQQQRHPQPCRQRGRNHAQKQQRPAK